MQPRIPNWPRAPAASPSERCRIPCNHQHSSLGQTGPTTLQPSCQSSKADAPDWNGRPTWQHYVSPSQGPAKVCPPLWILLSPSSSLRSLTWIVVDAAWTTKWNLACVSWVVIHPFMPESSLQLDYKFLGDGNHYLYVTQGWRQRCWSQAHPQQSSFFPNWAHFGELGFFVCLFDFCLPRPKLNYVFSLLNSSPQLLFYKNLGHINCWCSGTKSRLALCSPMDCSMPGFPVLHYLPEFSQTHVHWVRDAVLSSHPLSSPSPPTLSLSQHQELFQWATSLYQVAKVLELQRQSFQWIFTVDIL